MIEQIYWPAEFACEDSGCHIGESFSFLRCTATFAAQSSSFHVLFPRLRRLQPPSLRPSNVAAPVSVWPSYVNIATNANQTLQALAWAMSGRGFACVENVAFSLGMASSLGLPSRLFEGISEA